MDAYVKMLVGNFTGLTCLLAATTFLVTMSLCHYEAEFYPPHRAFLGFVLMVTGLLACVGALALAILLPPGFPPPPYLFLGEG